MGRQPAWYFCPAGCIHCLLKGFMHAKAQAGCKKVKIIRNYRPEIFGVFFPLYQIKVMQHFIAFFLKKI
jgi:hypothetical protein